MKKYVAILFIIISICSSLLYSQSGWLMQHPIPTNQSLMHIQMINSMTGYTAGRCGTLLKTTNAGVNWINLNVPTLKDIQSIFFFDGNTGYIGGYVGLFAKTTNGGLNWEFRSFDTTKSIMSIYFKNENEGYIGVYYGGLFRTINGGLNWTNLDTGNIYSINKIYFTSNSIGYASGVYETGFTFYGLVLKTTNGGLNWVMRQPQTITQYNSLKFFNDNTGYIGGEDVLYTTNGSITWSSMPKPTGKIYSFYFKDFNNGYILNYAPSESPKLYKTTTGGGTWVDLNISSKYYFYEISGVGDTLYLSGYLGTYAHSYNGGTNWIYHDVVNLSLYSIHFVNQLTGWSAGANGTLLYTDNGGETWKKKSLFDTTAYIMKILFVNDNTGFIGANGKIFRTTNAGNQWESYSLGTNNTFPYMSFVNSTTGFASTTIGEIYKTTNAGTNWDLIKNFNGTFYKDIHFFDDKKGLISKSLNGMNDILMTTNGGIDWNSVFVPACPLYDFYFSDQNTGYVSGTSKIYKTTNGGLNWTLSNSYTSAFMYSIYSIGDKVWACGGSGALLYSSNGGTNWQTQNTKTNQTLNSIIFLDSSVGYVCGNAGFIAKSTNSGLVFILKFSNAHPSSIFLEQNYPNPFNPSTKISFQLSVVSLSTLKIFDITGKEVATLVNELLAPGTYSVDWNAAEFPSGVYFYQMKVGNYSETKRMILVK